MLCLPYALLSIPFLVLSIVYDNEGDNDSSVFWVVEFGVGQCIDSCILILQLFALWQELNKQRPYTPIHLLFCIYLTIISIVRLVFILIYLTSEPYALTFIFMGFYLAFLINSVLLLGYWIAKKQELPEFEGHNYFNFEQLNLDTTRTLNRNIEISYLRKVSQTFSFIRPTVSVEKGRFKIVLEILDNTESSQKNDRQKSSVENNPPSPENRTTLKYGQKTNRSTPKLKIISNNTYGNNQILELYKICGRFNIKQKINFDSVKLGEMFKALQSYLNELFLNKKNYMKFMLKFFDVPEDYMNDCQRALRQTFKDSQFDMYANMDKNASIISVKIFKQLWVDDYYLFYMDILAIDGRFESRPMRRYNDFEMFHNFLVGIIRKKYDGKYQLPVLPKKYLFNWDEEKVTQRRGELESYLRSLTNDYKLMMDIPEVRKAALEFLGFFQSINLQPINDNFKSFYKNIEVLKGSIAKQLTNSEYVTFYEFKIILNGIPIRVFKKRFNQFITLHQSIQRWMHNTEISYKFLTLPEKHLYKSGTARHEKLKAYLQALIKIPDICKVYEVNSFLEVGNNSMKDISVSRIESPEEENWNMRKNTSGIINQEDDLQTQRFIDEDSYQSKGRMSALIDELGSN